MKLNPQIFARILLLAFLVLMILMFTGCKSKKKLVEKKQETVSVLEQNDIKTAEKIKSDIKTISISSSQEISISPVDDKISSKVIYKGDTLSFVNAKVKIKNHSATESKEDKSEAERSTSDQSSKKSKAQSSEKSTNIAKTGTHPALIWGGLLLILIIMVLLYFRKKIPFL